MGSNFFSGKTVLEHRGNHHLLEGIARVCAYCYPGETILDLNPAWRILGIRVSHGYCSTHRDMLMKMIVTDAKDDREARCKADENTGILNFMRDCGQSLPNPNPSPAPVPKPSPGTK